MRIFALSDLHLSFGVPGKSMDVFGSVWKDHPEKIEKYWKELILPEDLVLLAGDLSWAMRMEDVLADFAWLDALPGTKLIIKGNHDYWWSSLNKVKKALPPSIHAIQNDVFIWNNVAIGGARLWDSSEYSFNPYIDFQENLYENKEKAEKTEDFDSEKIFTRELERLTLSLSKMPKDAIIKIVMTHYPPIGANLEPSKVSKILEHFGINICVFGHLHNVKKLSLPFGEKDHIQYYLTSCDYLHFKPLKIFESI
jgi:hypothetical protein